MVILNQTAFHGARTRPRGPLSHDLLASTAQVHINVALNIKGCRLTRKLFDPGALTYMRNAVQIS